MSAILQQNDGHAINPRIHHRHRRVAMIDEFIVPVLAPRFHDSPFFSNRVDAELAGLNITRDELFRNLALHTGIRRPPQRQRSDINYRLCHKCDHLFGLQFQDNGRTIKVLLEQRPNHPHNFCVVKVFDATGPLHGAYNTWITNWESRWANLPQNFPRYSSARYGRRRFLLPQQVTFPPL